jgi:hypothetical protein
MVDDKKLQQTIDRNEIEHLIAKSIIARDSGLWKELAECYHPDAKLTSSWFTGTPAEFLKKSQEMKIVRHEGEVQKHMTGNHWIEVKGDRAVAESDLILYQRRVVDGLELDFTTWSRRLHMMAKRDGDWKIFRRTSIYEKDRIDPHNPDDVPEGFYSSMDLSKYPREIRYHCWLNDVVGYPPAKNICVKGTEREKEVREEARRWIEGGAFAS